MIYEDNLAPAYKFAVFLGVLTIRCSKISGISNEIPVQPIREGGVNDKVYYVHASRQSGDRLIFEHGIGSLNPMNLSFRVSMLGMYLMIPGIIVVYSNKKILRAYSYINAMPVKWSVSDFDAQSNSLVIDRIEIIHQGIEEIPIPF